MPIYWLTEPYPLTAIPNPSLIITPAMRSGSTHLTDNPFAEEGLRGRAAVPPVVFLGGDAPPSHTSNIHPSAQKTQLTMHLYSPEFLTGTSIPFKYTCDGENHSPPLTWQDAPNGTQSFVLIVHDRDAPHGKFTHWVLYNLPPEMRQLPEAVPTQETLLNGSKQGTNDFNTIGFGGPCPPNGTHRYFFKLYALDHPLDLAPGATKEQVLHAMEGHVLDAAELMGLYGKAHF